MLKAPGETDGFTQESDKYVEAYAAGKCDETGGFMKKEKYYMKEKFTSQDEEDFFVFGERDESS